MKKRLLGLIAVVFLCNALRAQKLQTVERIMLNDTKSPIIWIDTMKTDINHLLVDKESFDSLKIVKDTDIAARRYGVGVAAGMLIMFPGKGVRVMRLPQFLEYQGVPQADRKLRICVNHTLIKFPEFLIIDPAYVRTVQITPKRHYSLLDEAYTGELFLNILTRDYSNPVLQ